MRLRSGPFWSPTNLIKENPPAASYWPTESPISRLLVYASTAVNMACVSELEMVNFWRAGRLHTKVVVVFAAILFLEILLLTKK